MKCLAIADLFINAAMMESGLKALRDNGIEVEVREWSHGSVEKLQEDNLRVEQEGAEAVALPEALLQGTDDIDILITQFAKAEICRRAPRWRGKRESSGGERPGR